MKLYVRLEFSPEGTDPFTVITMLKDIGFSAVLGDYDFAYEYAKPNEYKDAIDKMHDRLKGTGVRYSIASKHS